jgi:ubiquinone/menaquinone biosynthesis C-methylase UbiE
MNRLNTERLREHFNKYTVRAFNTIPKINKPRILDIGCGSGIPTLQLAKLTDGEIIGIDLDQLALEQLNKKIDNLGLTDRVTTKKCSLFKLDYEEESFDIIWAEGSIAVIGFRRGLLEWGRVLKRKGFMVFHDDLVGKKEKVKLIRECGYCLINHFKLPDDIWWEEYYKPLQEQINKLSLELIPDTNLVEEIEKYQKKIACYKKDPGSFRSIFYIIQKAQKQEF